MGFCICKLCNAKCSTKANLDHHISNLCQKNHYKVEILPVINLEPSVEEEEFFRLYNIHQFGSWHFKYLNIKKHIEVVEKHNISNVKRKPVIILIIS